MTGVTPKLHTNNKYTKHNGQRIIANNFKSELASNVVNSKVRLIEEKFEQRCQLFKCYSPA